jgi:hypothetical protein
MVTITLHCPHCESDALVRNGRAPMHEACLLLFLHRYNSGPGYPA